MRGIALNLNVAIEAQTLSVQRLARSDPHHTQPSSG